MELKYLSLLFLVLLSCGLVSGTSYYYNQSGGNDANDCSTPALACKTIADLNTKSPGDGDTIYFACGETWRLPGDAYPEFGSGSSSSNITYTSYGSCNNGNKPLFLGSYSANENANWTDTGGNIWVTNFTISSDVGNIIFNNDNHTGLKRSALASLDTQGEYYYNYTTDKLYLYSITNPATYYDIIELAKKTHIFNIEGSDYIIVKNLHLKYTGAHGISGRGEYIYIINNTLDYIGGSYQDEGGTTRYGNGIEIGLTSNNTYIGYNNVSQVYDAGITHQAWDTESMVVRIENAVVEYNIILKCGYGYEYFNNDDSAVTNNLLVHHNTIGYSNSGWYEGSRHIYDMGIRLARHPAGSTNITIRDNLFINESYRFIDNSLNSWLSSYPTINYNLYYNGTSPMFTWNGTSRNTLSDLVSGTPFEDNGIYANPLLDVNYIPASNSPACNMSSTGSYVGALPCDTVLYVNNSNINCSDTYTRNTVRNSSTPWCGANNTMFTQIQSGDTLFFECGNYSNTNGYTLSQSFTSETIIDGNNCAILHNNIGDLTWNNQSSTVAGLWNASYATSSSYLGVMQSIGNKTMFIYPYTTTGWSRLINTTYPEGCFYNTSNDYLYCRFQNTSYNPNNNDFYISKGNLLTLTGTYNVTIKNMIFKGGLKSIYYTTENTDSDIIIDNSYFTGATGTSGATGTGILDFRNSGGITIKNSYIQQIRSDDWDWTTTKGGPMEETALRFENCKSGITIYNNTIYSSFNGIYFTSDTVGQLLNPNISNNRLENIFDDAIELENYGSGAYVYNNNCTDAFVCLSVIPYNSTYQQTRIQNNIFDSNKNNFFELPSTYYYGEAIKIAGTGSAINLYFDHNTIIGKATYANSGQSHILYNTNFTNNIFYNPYSNRILDKSGLANDNVFYDYNLYYRTDNNNYFKYWNNDTSITEYNLTEALASSNWDGTWDVNSNDANPLLNNYIPASNSPACGNASDGGDIGALPCANPDATYILQEGYETGYYNTSMWSNQTAGQSYSLTFTNTGVYGGNYSAKFTSSCNDELVASGLRSELSDVSTKPYQETWTGFATRVDDEWETGGTYFWAILAQWHATEDPGEAGISPPLALDLKNGSYYISVGNTTLKNITANTDSNRTYNHYQVADFEPGVWNEWVFHVKWSPNYDGVLEVWKDGVVVLNRTNLPIGYNDTEYPYFKAGIYRMNASTPTYCNKTVYNDAFTITDQYGDFDIVNPAQYRNSVVCKGKSNIYCTLTGCFYGGNECTESSAFRTGSITCTTEGCT